MVSKAQKRIEGAHMIIMMAAHLALMRVVKSSLGPLTRVSQRMLFMQGRPWLAALLTQRDRVDVMMWDMGLRIEIYAIT